MEEWKKCREALRLEEEWKKCREAFRLEEWKKYREAFRKIAEVIFERTLGKDASPGDQNQVWLTLKVAKVVGEKEVLKRIEKDNQMQGCCT